MYLLTLLYAAACYLGLLALYRLFLHPLRKYPGPLLAALTEGYEVYYNIVQGGGLVHELIKLHEIYGPIVRIGPNKLHFKDRQAFHDIYTYGSTLLKDPAFYHGLIAHAPESSVYFCDPQQARDRRALLAPLFSRRAVIKLEYTIQGKIDKLLRILQDRHDSLKKSIPMSVTYHSLTTDIITSYCFAESVNTLDTPNFSHPLLVGVQEVIKGLWVQRYFPFINRFAISLPKTILLWLLPAFKGFVEMQEGFERQIGELRRDFPEGFKKVDHETIYHHLLEPKNQKRPSMKSLVSEAFTLVIAGSDTVAHACTIGTFYALKDSSIRQKLTDELQEAWPDKDRPMSYVDLEKLPYLTALVKESVRFSLGVCHPLPRIVGRETPAIAGLNLPPGTIVGMSALFLHMNPEVFVDPFTFNPDRWLAEDVTQMNLDLAPFSKGPRICLGWCELYLILANIFRRLDLQLVTGDK
ncbi:hypothetical protein GYMLUDRAFT_179261 [Collybiopsis luxurians FD-317 M1]|uniref:Unplaced genomic scaffold GYMLUscaffold_84, whole genome shotgun sequence n=1 Tax=Collybiopsis luxurians FD-317 M1 TaxID=944289 RepID=A0A0D0C5Q7_9AGAR|nr:hypothetical protein GYMLUDRAFT_179261 [Collybiopsis luxurians FD-317 M1]